MPHFHVLMNCEPPARRNKQGKITKHALHDFAVSKGWGHQADLKPVNDDQAAWYVAKYASKQSPETPKNFRRVRASRNWTKLAKSPGPPLIVRAQDEPLFDFIERLSEHTGMSYDDCYDAYVRGKAELELERAYVSDIIEEKKDAR